jgi:hypothetical protein
VNALKGLFQDSKAIKEQYREGMMGRTAGFDFYENTLLANLTSGTASRRSPCYRARYNRWPLRPARSTSSPPTASAPATLVVGDVFTIATLNRVHPETKANTGVLQQFVVTAAMPSATFSSIAFSPAIQMSGATQNVISTVISGQLIAKVGNSSRVTRQSLVYHKNAFAFVTADLALPKGLHFAAREVQDGISLRILSDYAMSSDTIGTRVDILYGFKTLRGSQAVKIAS